MDTESRNKSRLEGFPRDIKSAVTGSRAGLPLHRKPQIPGVKGLKRIKSKAVSTGQTGFPAGLAVSMSNGPYRLQNLLFRTPHP